MSTLDKAALRRRLRQLRASLSASQRRDGAERAARQALRLPALRKARRVAAFLSYGSELNTAPLLRRLLARGQAVYVPRLGRQGMHFVRIGPHSALRRNRHGIREPVGRRRCGAVRMDVILMPLLGYDAHGNRLGSGAGHYDRSLARRRPFRRPLRVGYAYVVQQLTTLPRDPWDVPMDAVVTDQGILRCSTG